MSQRSSYFKYEVMKVSKTIVKVSKVRKTHIKSLPRNNQQGLDTDELQSDEKCDKNTVVLYDHVQSYWLSKRDFPQQSGPKSLYISIHTAITPDYFL